MIGYGKLVVPVDFAVRRPDPMGAGGPCRDTLRRAREMLDERLAALDKRGLHLPPPIIPPPIIITAPSYGHDCLEGTRLWRTHPWEPRVRYVRSQATSPTYGAVTVVIVDESGEDRYYTTRVVCKGRLTMEEIILSLKHY